MERWMDRQFDVHTKILVHNVLDEVDKEREPAANGEGARVHHIALGNVSRNEVHWLKQLHNAENVQGHDTMHYTVGWVLIV